MHMRHLSSRIAAVVMLVFMTAVVSIAQDAAVSGNGVEAPIFAGPLPVEITDTDNVFHARLIRVSVDSPEGLGLYSALGSAKVTARSRIVGAILQLPMINGKAGYEVINTDGLVSALQQLVFRYADECGDTPEQARRYDAGLGEGSICMEIGVDNLFRQLVYDKKLRAPLYAERGQSNFFIPAETGAPVAAYDSVVIDARQVDFTPALVNRVFTDNATLVYDPLMVNGAEPKFPRSPATAINIDRARVMLAERGASQPLFITATDAVNENGAVIEARDASVMRRAANAYPIFDYGNVVFIYSPRDSGGSTLVPLGGE